MLLIQRIASSQNQLHNETTTQTNEKDEVFALDLSQNGKVLESFDINLLDYNA